MIILNNKSFFIDFNPNLNHNYTIFPSLEHCNQFSSNTYHITGLHSFIKSVKFTEAQNKIIQSEFKPIFVKIKNDNQNQRITCEEIPQSPFNVGTFLELISRMDNIQIQIERRHENSIIESEDESIDDDQTLVEQFDELQIHDTDSDIDSENSDEYMESDSEN
jgi:hypothetical protein